jgi:predicted glycoside hydrolase/deacetylase ChbG (UPF0249 family)
VDLGEWVFREDTWVPVYEVVPRNDPTRVAEEITRQLVEFRRLVGRQPTHIDSHQHVHRQEPVRSILLRMARHLGVPLRSYSRVVRYCGDFYGQTAQGSPLPELISVENLIAILTALPGGFTELGCHPGLAGDLNTMYRTERTKEVSVLCDARVRTAIASLSVQLCSFSAVAHP